MPKKSSNEKSKVLNGCWFHNIATVKAPDRLKMMVTYPVWHIIFVEAPGIKISGFYKAKHAMVELMSMCERFYNMKEKGQPVLKLWQDNASKQKELVKRLKRKDWKLDVEGDFMARDTPQQNH